MILTGSKHIKLINPAQVISLELYKGKPTAFVKGTSIDGDIKIDSLSVREPWTVIINTVKDTHYINRPTFEEALEELIEVAHSISPIDKQGIRTLMRKTYGR